MFYLRFMQDVRCFRCIYSFSVGVGPMQFCTSTENIQIVHGKKLFNKLSSVALNCAISSFLWKFWFPSSEKVNDLSVLKSKTNCQNPPKRGMEYCFKWMMFKGSSPMKMICLIMHNPDNPESETWAIFSMYIHCLRDWDLNTLHHVFRSCFLSRFILWNRWVSGVTKLWKNSGIS